MVYRALNSGSFDRFEFLGNVESEPHWWRVFHADGTVSQYGEKARHPFAYAPLMSVVDGDGHELKYFYASVSRTSATPSVEKHPKEFLPTAVEYRSPGTGYAYAQVYFQWGDPAFCGDPNAGSPAVGSLLSYRFGFGLLSGTRQLNRIVTATKAGPTVGSVTAREYVLNYDSTAASCSAGSTTPYRKLDSVQQIVYSPNVTGSGSVTVLPPTEFTYGKAASYAGESQYEAPVETVANLRVPESVDTVQHPFANPDQPQTHTFAPGGWATSAQPFGAVPETKLPHGTYSSASIPWAVAVGQATGESMSRSFVDVNGDGLVDILARAGGAPSLAVAVPATGGCMVDVYLNRGTAGFVKNDPEFPAFSLRNAMADVPVAAGTPASGAGELICSLSRSLSADDSGGWLGDPSKPCAAQPEWDTTAGWGSMQQVQHAYIDVDGDRKRDLVSQPISSIHCPYESTHGIPDPNEWDPPADEIGNKQPDPNWSTEFVAHELLHNKDSENPNESLWHNGTRKITKRQTNWYVYRNTGSGFAATPTVLSRLLPTHPNQQYHPDWPDKHSGVTPVPSENLVGGYTAHWSVQGAGSYPLVEWNGDGFPDAPGTMQVRPGKPGSTFGHYVGLSSEEGACYDPNDQFCLTRNRLGVWRARSGADDVDSPTHYTGFEMDSMVDLNGDGLADQIQAWPGWDYAQVDFNTGAGLGSDGGKNGVPGAGAGGRVHYSDDHLPTKYMSSFRVPDLSNRNWQHYPTTGQRYGTTRMIDVDYDGLVDTVSWDGTTGRVFANGGGQWVRETAASAEVVASLTGRIDARGTVAQYADRGDYRYTQTRGAVDLNGDGLLDLVSDMDDDGAAEVRYAKPILNTTDDYRAPARLLRTVSNGYGAKTTIDYVRDVSRQAWVAEKVSVDPGGQEPAMATRHVYKSPVFGPNPYGLTVFRGYADVRSLREGVNAADARTTIIRYAFDRDPRGLPTREVVIAGDALGLANPDQHPNTMSVVDSTYHVKELPGLRAPGMVPEFPSRVVLPQTTTTYMCQGTQGQTASNCSWSNDRTVSETFWQSYSVDGEYVMELPSRTETRFTNGAGQTETRRGSVTQNVAWSPSAFNVAPATITNSHVLGGVTTTLGSTEYTYLDGEFRRVHQITVHDATAGAPDRITRFAYHEGTGANRGLVRRSWSPRQSQNAGGDNAPGYTEYGYDTAGVHVVRTTNPVGHVMTATVDLGTGATLSTEGPDYVCADGTPLCTFDQAAYRQRTVSKVDGLGRPVETTTYPASAGSAVVVARASYNDSAAWVSDGADPVTTTMEAASGDGDYSHTLTTLDGLGRTTSVTEQQDPQADQTITYDYDTAGRLSKVHRPSASAVPGTVTIQTIYDALDRPTQVKEIAPGNLVFSNTAYDGLTTTVSQDATDLSSPASVTKTTLDALGQVALVREKSGDADGTDVFTSTTYTYDPEGNTREIRDPDGAVTTLAHNHFGDRTAITTGGRTWSYGYDLDGNMVSVTEPLPLGGTTAAYTHTSTYDAVGRVLTETPAHRGLNQTERDALRIGVKKSFYDRKTPVDPGMVDPCPTIPANAPHMIGRLVCTDSPAVTVENRYNDRGHSASTSQSLKTPASSGISNDRVVINFDFHPTGTLDSHTVTTVRNDGTISHQGPTVATFYDRDGTPNSITMKLGATNKDMTIANTRNSAGVVTTRNININNATGYATPSMSWAHDRFGRTTSLKAHNGTQQRYKQDYLYNNTGQIRQTKEQLGLTTQPTLTTDYTYDHRQQLLTATRTGGGTGTDYANYTGIFTYTPGGRVNSANIATAGPAAVRVPTRNVTHEYGADNDPQRLKTLRKPDNTTVGGDYTYDEAGNTLTRAIHDGPAGTTTTITQTWDGSNLRKVTRPTGESETYFYDGHTRIAAVHRNNTGQTIDTKRWFGPLEITDTPTSNPQHRHTITLAGDTIARLDGDKNTGTLEHYLTTPLGHHVLALDATTANGGANTRRIASYGPYGELLTQLTNAGTPASKYPTEFNGKNYDATGGLHYYGYRNYDPLTLSWTSSDPLYRYAPDLNQTNPRAANLYTYTDNNPTNRHDPNGLCTSLYACAKGAVTTPTEDVDATARNIGNNGMSVINWLNEPLTYGSPHVAGEKVKGTRLTYILDSLTVLATRDDGAAPAYQRRAPTSHRATNRATGQPTPKPGTRIQGTDADAMPLRQAGQNITANYAGGRSGSAKPLKLGNNYDSRVADLQDAGEAMGKRIAHAVGQRTMSPGVARQSVAGGVSQMNLPQQEAAIVAAEATRHGLAAFDPRGSQRSYGIFQVGRDLVVPLGVGPSAPLFVVRSNGFVHAGHGNVAFGDGRDASIGNIVISSGMAMTRPIR
ncbi:RHS repeat-associated core domain-containing protein [Actinokineospora sp. HUAS TT18]|uniref:RHS repeat-associated core domain-containing protein n=1 Tax=Actinokineospora sp. HUAS TT18 TaxID=3447451 RepID=UPI003F51E0CF